MVFGSDTSINRSEHAQLRKSQFNAQLVPIGSVRANPNNARTHDRRQIRKIVNSIRAFGFLGALLVDADGLIVAGHARWTAARQLGMTHVPVIRLGNLSPRELSAYLLADNRLAEDAGWHSEILKETFQILMSAEDLSLDIGLTGFEPAEIDLAMTGAGQHARPEESVFVRSDLTPVSHLGDLWCLGKHRVLCANALDPSSFSALMERKMAAVVCADAPFNVRIDGNVTGKGAVHHREFSMASGEMSESEFVSFLRTCFHLLAKHSRKGSVHYLFIDFRHMGELLSASREVYSDLLNLCVWVKNSGGMGSFYRSQHELVFVFRNGKGKHQNNVQLGKYGRNRTNVWEYPNVATFSKQGDEGNLLALHPTVKPVALVADAILDCSSRGDIVLDCFLGSGTTLMAAERVGRICYGMEIDPLYVDTAIRRWQKQTGEVAIHAESGKTFNELEAERMDSDAEIERL